MTTTYLALKLVHIFLAITAVGSNVTYGVWFARARREPTIAAAYLRGVKFIDDYVANPCYVLLLITGAILVWVGGIGFATHWVSAAFGLWIVLALLGLLGYSPLLKRYIAVVESDGIASPRAEAVATRANLVSALIALDALAILYVMVFKPA